MAQNLEEKKELDPGQSRSRTRSDPVIDICARLSC